MYIEPTCYLTLPWHCGRAFLATRRRPSHACHQACCSRHWARAGFNLRSDNSCRTLVRGCLFDGFPLISQLTSMIEHTEAVTTSLPVVGRCGSSTCPRSGAQFIPANAVWPVSTAPAPTGCWKWTRLPDPPSIGVQTADFMWAGSYVPQRTQHRLLMNWVAVHVAARSTTSLVHGC